MTTQQVVNFPAGIVPTIETHLMYPSALPTYLQENFQVPVRLPHAAIADLCTMDEPTVVLLSLSPAPVRPPLLVWLPDARPEQLLSLGSVEPEVENHTSPDLRSSRTFLVWRRPGSQLEVRLDTWELSPYLAGFESELAVCFIGPGQVIAARLNYSSQEAEALTADLQAAASGSGPNWQPRRIYSDAEMLSAEGQVAPQDSSLIVPRVASLTLGSQPKAMAQAQA